MTRAFYALFLLLAPTYAFAYLDPGTGSLLLYAIFGMAMTAAFALRNLWYAARSRISLRGAARRGAKGNALPDVVFQSEGGRYWQVFKPVVDALARAGVRCAYVTPDPADPALSLELPGFSPLRPGGEMATIAWMNAVSAPLVVSTTPHLDVYQLRRSRSVKHYAHLFHAPTDVCFYEKYAFDWYDTLLTVGPFQEASVRALERLRGTREKTLLPTGCTYFDYMLAERADGAPPEEDIVLYAPAWGMRSSVVTHGTGIIDALADAGQRVIFRPHPQFYVSHRALIADIERRYRDSPLVEIDRNRTGNQSMARSRAMVTDLSGVLFDYACLHGKPIVLANADIDPAGQEGEDLPRPLWDAAASVELAFARVGDDPSEVVPACEAARGARAAYADRAKDFRDRSFFHFGQAGEAAARNIVDILGRI